MWVTYLHVVTQLMSGKHPTWYLSLGANASDKERLAVIKKDTYNGAHSASLFLASNTTQFFAQPIPDYSARGDFGNRSFFIYHGWAPVAEVRLMPLTCANVCDVAEVNAYSVTHIICTNQVSGHVNAPVSTIGILTSSQTCWCYLK